MLNCLFFFFKQKTAYEMRISDWSSDVCSSDLAVGVYLPYRPSRIAIPCASAHPTALVESIAMGSITAPRPSYVPKLPAGVVDKRVLSDAQQIGRASCRERVCQYV